MYPSLKEDVETDLPIPPSIDGEKLESWKEIAAFFRREVRTVQLWEKREGLPVRRQLHNKIGSIFAYRTDLERWWRERLHSDEARPQVAEKAILQRAVPAASAEQRSGISHSSAVTPDNLLARHACSLGNYFWSQRSRSALLRSMQYFEDAIELDSEYAEGYAGLANAYVSLSYNHLMPSREAASKAHAAIDTAMRLDRNNLQVGNAFINVMTNCTWQWEKAQQQYLRMHETGHLDGRTIQLYSSLLAAMGQHDKAVELALQAHRLSPSMAQVSGQAALAYLYGGDYSSALHFIHHTLELEPRFTMGYVTLGRIESELGQWNKAITAFNKAAENMSHSLLSQALLAFAFAGSGEENRARRMLAEVEARSSESCYPAYETAAVYALLDERDSALNCLKRAIKTRDMKTIFVKHDPRFARLRETSGFEEVTSRFIL
ncbi:tetratricopeptide repeat protein [Silvibacterium acidisoli]|uniref:tetratricopeptide repeat protein n=1 Tax=Acidobacteriaceae bacterium ZG23-2 TaxID=2883246 RepID=UPI00406C6DF9